VITHDPVRFWASVRPDRVAIRSPRSLWTYRALDAAIWAAADALLERGLGAGEHLALEFSPEDAVAFAVAFHAAQRVGLLPEPIPRRPSVRPCANGPRSISP